MSVEKRLGLLLDLAVLDPPPFKSEEFARWCCQTTVSLLARNALAVDATPPLPPGVFLAFTPYIPGHEDLPRLGRDMDHPSLQVVGRAHPVVTTAEGEEVDVLVVIYEMVRIVLQPGPLLRVRCQLTSCIWGTVGPSWPISGGRQRQETRCSSRIHVQTTRDLTSPWAGPQLPRIKRVPYVRALSASVDEASPAVSDVNVM